MCDYTEPTVMQSGIAKREQKREKKKAKSDNFEIEKLYIAEEPQAQELILNCTVISNHCIMNSDILRKSPLTGSII